MSRVKAPAGAQVVDARGKYLVPGLWDLHAHPRRLAHLFYPLFLANGVTGIRDAGSDVHIDTLVMWRREILAGTRVGPPRQVLSAHSIAGPLKGCKRAETQGPQTCVTDAADARRYVDSIVDAGADMIKPRELNRELFLVVAAAARQRGVPFGGHLNGFPPLEASDSGASIIDHSVGLRLWPARGSGSQRRWSRPRAGQRAAVSGSDGGAVPAQRHVARADARLGI